jgi:hypothetical protein
MVSRLGLGLGFGWVLSMPGLAASLLFSFFIALPVPSMLQQARARKPCGREADPCGGRHAVGGAGAASVRSGVRPLQGRNLDVARAVGQCERRQGVREAGTLCGLG